MTCSPGTPLSKPSRKRALFRDDGSQKVDTKGKAEIPLSAKTLDLVLATISQEVKKICAPEAKSQFRDSSLQGLQNANFQDQFIELQNYTPVLLRILQCVAVRPDIQRNKTKDEASLTPAIVSAASVLFNCHSQEMNNHQVLTGLTLLAGNSSKVVFNRLHARKFSASYKTVVNKQRLLGEGHDDRVKLWASSIHQLQQTQVRPQNLGSPSQSEAEHHHTSQDTTDEHTEVRLENNMYFQLVMDNVDINVRSRYTSTERHGSDYHMANTMAVRDRVCACHLSDEVPAVSLDTVDLGIFLPSISDNKLLINEWSILIGHIISDHIPSLQWMSKELPGDIPHRHLSEARKKSEVVGLGVLMENENTADGIHKILKHLHTYVPDHGTETISPILSAGDLLTCEREQNCILEQQNSKSPSQRFDGLVPVLADFHTFANFLVVMWQTLYDTSSSADKGTLYGARNYLEARNVTKNPMKDVNAASDLVEVYTKSLIIAAALKYFGMDQITSEPQKNQFNLATHKDIKVYVKQTLEEIVTQFVIPERDELSKQAPQFQCMECTKEYKTKNGLKQHIKNKHGFQTERKKCNESDESSQQDAVFNYARCALSLGLIALNFTDARRKADGERLMRLYKYMLLHFKASGKIKYSFQSLRLLAQIKCFLSPQMAYRLTWNRSVNKTGTPNGNIEMDREMEHQNRIFKDQCKAMRGKITPKGVERVSHAAQRIDDILCGIDKQMNVKRQSGKHASPERKKDIVGLAMEMHKSRLFENQPGRRSFSLQSFPPSLLVGLDVPTLYKWIRTTLKSLSREPNFGKACRQVEQILP